MIIFEQPESVTGGKYPHVSMSGRETSKIKKI
jgi:hypothetical protein